MPDCEHQHITFTMPSELWPIFEANPEVLNDLFSLVANLLQKEECGISLATKLDRTAQTKVRRAKLISIEHIQNCRQWHFLLERQYQRYWNIHFTKKT